ncbi:acyl-CoA dehydrogenase family protein [Catellatospora sp. TT07R-123]|uniref:acyl-CoA dehydrogenase family protein n=1 Tax=Catellatospora sp. TT07R-123 TaxID=2733863 RepID=UPI001FD53926|nr:acyl-CoA dehydrogenase family protein [Catellatospora sp. TT07R-123]
MRGQTLIALADRLIGDRADEWDRRMLIPQEVIRGLAGAGALCPDVPDGFGGPGLSMLDTGELTAHVGSLCSSVRSLMTSHGMAAWTVRRFGTPVQQHEHLRRFTSGTLAAVAVSEPEAGSDLAAVTTRVESDGADLVLSGRKVWVTAAAYADDVLVFGRYGAAGAAVLVPMDSAGLTVRVVPDPLGCRAAGHADLEFDRVRVPRDRLLGSAGVPLEWLVTAALTYGRLSVAWGCVGILRACLRAAARHAVKRRQFGAALAEHQLVGAHLAELLVAERAATHTCRHAGHCWDEAIPELATAAVIAKHLAATGAARGAAAAVQVLASAGAHDGHPVARAYRDAKLMEIIEGSSEISQLLLARHVIDTWS